jgi:hypothetical protein
MKKLTTILAVVTLSFSLISCAVTEGTRVGKGCMSRYFVGYAKADKVKYEDDIHNPANYEYVGEVAFNLGIKASKVTQEQFNSRYGLGK